MHRVPKLDELCFRMLIGKGHGAQSQAHCSILGVWSRVELEHSMKLPLSRYHILMITARAYQNDWKLWNVEKMQTGIRNVEGGRGTLKSCRKLAKRFLTSSIIPASFPKLAEPKDSGVHFPRIHHNLQSLVTLRIFPIFSQSLCWSWNQNSHACRVGNTLWSILQHS